MNFKNLAKYSIFGLFAIFLGFNLGFFSFTYINNKTVALNLLTILIFLSPVFFSRNKFLALILYFVISLPAFFFVYLPIQLDNRTRPSAPYRAAYLSDSCEYIKVSLICNSQDISTRLLFSIRCGDISFIKDQRDLSDKRCER